MKRIVVALIVLCLILTGCFGESAPEAAESVKPAESSASVNENPVDPSGNKTAKLSANGAATVLDLKKKYGSESNKAIMPFYNVSRNEVFTFKFAASFDHVNDASDIITVHTDIKALPASKLFTFTSFTEFRNLDTIEVKPGWSVLASSATKGGIENAGWGQAPIYYIRINYDLDAKVPTKLDVPLIIPFTIKSELPVPTLKYEIDASGNYKLLWSEVDGATSYRVYKRAQMMDSDAPLSGPESGYAGIGYPLLEREVEGTELSWFLSSFEPKLPDETYVTYQNQGLGGEYYVTAVQGDKESNFSNVASLAALSSQLPSELITNIGFNRYDRLDSLPVNAEVEMIDGSVAIKEFVFDYVSAVIDELGRAKINYTIKGTAFKGYITVENLTQAELDQKKSEHQPDANAGFVEPDNETDYVPAPDVPTIIEPTNGETSTDDGLTASQIANTEQQVEEANQQHVPVPESTGDIVINASSAFEEYMALNLIAGNDKISLAAFPEAQNYETLEDVMLEVVYQNPLILGVAAWRYNYATLTLEMYYDYTADEIKQKQKEIMAEAPKIVAKIIQPEMSVEDKHKAIYDYLNDNTQYDNAALEDAQANGFKEVDAKYNDSFTTYGIMVNKVGVCASYAATYKMLSDLAGLESIVVTGDMGGVPHAWNKIKLDNGWVHVDATNNATNSGIPYLLYNASDEIAMSLDFKLSDEYWADHELSQFDALDDSKEYYRSNGMEVFTAAEYGAKLKNEVEAGKTHIVIRYAGVFDSDAILEEVLDALESVPEEKLEDARLGSLGSYIILSY